jgi:photosystem II stability/assembly factor-like uncharacterized protein
MKKLLLCLFFIGSMQAQDFWTEVTPFENANYFASQISIVNDNVVWVQGSDPWNPTAIQKWSRSTDAGNTWVSGNIDLGNLVIKASCLHAISATTAYVSAYSATPGVLGGVWVTTDSGATWTKQDTALFNGENSFANAIHFWDSNNGIVIGDPENGYFEVYTTSDAGITWTRVPEANFPELDEGEYGYSYNYENRGNSLWFGTNKGNMYISHDRGQNWEKSQTPITDFGSANSSASFAFKNDNEGIILSREFEFYRTTDGGQSWTQEWPSGQFRNRQIVCIPQTMNTYFNWGEDIDFNETGSAYSTDGCASWINLDIVQHLDIQTAKFLSGSTGYCIAREHGSIANPLNFYRLTDPLNRLGTTPLATTSAFNAVPNPTTGLVKLSGKAINSVVVCDVSGKVVLQNQYHSLDNVVLDISALQSGIYFARISNSSGAVENTKIIKK